MKSKRAPGSDRSMASMYLDEMGRHPMMTREEERATGQRIQDGRAAIIAALVAPCAIAEILKLGQRLRERDLALVDIVSLTEAETDDARLENEREDAFLAGIAVLRCKGPRLETVAALGLSDAAIARIAKGVRKQAGFEVAGARETLQAIRTGEREVAEARAALVKANLRIVIGHARNRISFGIPFLDLIQEGNLGLVKAAERFEPQRGLRFATYATWWVKQMMGRHIDNSSRTIVVPVHVNENIRKANRARGSLGRRLGRSPTIEEIADEARLTPTKVMDAQFADRRILAIDRPLGGDTEDLTMHDVLPSPSVCPVLSIDQKRISNAIKSAIGTLTSREQDVIRLRFGIGVKSELTLEEIGALYGVTRERVRQIESRAMMKLKHPSATKQLRQMAEAV